MGAVCCCRAEWPDIIGMCLPRHYGKSTQLQQKHQQGWASETAQGRKDPCCQVCNTGTETLEPNSQPYWKWRVPVQRETWLKNISWKELEDTQSQSLAPHTQGQVHALFHRHTLIQQRGASIFIDKLMRSDLGGLERWPGRTKHLLLFQRTWVLSSVPSPCIRWIPSFNSSLRKSKSSSGLHVHYTHKHKHVQRHSFF